MTEPANGPTLVFLFEQPTATGPGSASWPAGLEEFLHRLCREPSFPATVLVAAGFRIGAGDSPSPAGDLLFHTIHQGEIFTTGDSPISPFASPSFAFLAVADFLLRRADAGSPVVAIHLTASPLAGSAKSSARRACSRLPSTSAPLRDGSVISG